MPEPKGVLIVGLDPFLIDFSGPDFAYFNMTAENVVSAAEADVTRLDGLGYAAEPYYTDVGETAGSVLAERLQIKPWDCILIGAGVRLPPSNFLLFERLVNVVMAGAPQAKLCFNTRPTTLPSP